MGSQVEREFPLPAVPREFRGSVPRPPKRLLHVLIFSIDDEASQLGTESWVSPPQGPRKDMYAESNSSSISPGENV